MTSKLVPVHCSECGSLDMVREDYLATLPGPFHCSQRCLDVAYQRDDDNREREAWAREQQEEYGEEYGDPLDACHDS